MEGGEYSIEYVGIFKADASFTDSITQQQVISSTPTIWVERPTPIPMVQDLRVRWKDQYFSIKEIHNDTDQNAYNLLLHEIPAPAEQEEGE